MQVRTPDSPKLTQDCSRLRQALQLIESLPGLLYPAPRGTIWVSLTAITMAGIQLIVAVAPIDSAQFARSVREDTAELASYVLSDKKDKRSASFLSGRPSLSSRPGLETSDPQDEVDCGESISSGAGTIEEVSEPPSPQAVIDSSAAAGPSALSSMFKHSPLQAFEDEAAGNGDLEDADQQAPLLLTRTVSSHNDSISSNHGVSAGASESTPLLGPKRSQPGSPSTASEFGDIESQKPQTRSSWNQYLTSLRYEGERKLHQLASSINPKTWDRRTVWQHAIVAPARCVPSVIVGLLLNILDALSYGRQHSCPFVGSEAYCQYRNDLVSAGEPDLLQTRARGYIHILRQHDHSPVDFLIRQCV